jgi:hypothetical protein
MEYRNAILHPVEHADDEMDEGEETFIDPFTLQNSSWGRKPQLYGVRMRLVAGSSS